MMRSIVTRTFDFKLMMILCLAISLSFKIVSASPSLQPQEVKVSSQPLLSGLMLERFDQSVRPQDDFYRFVNGRWLDTFELPPEKSRYGVFNDLHERAREQLKEIILGLSTKGGQAQSAEAKQVSDAYQAFMAEARLEELRLIALREDLDKIQSLKNSEDLMKYFGYQWRLGSTGPINGWVDQDAKNPTEYILYLTQSGLGLPDRDYYLKDDDTLKETRIAYQSYLKGVFDRSETPALVTHSALLAESVLQLEGKLASAQWTRAESRQREKTYNKMQLKILNRDSTLDWTAFFQGLKDSQDAQISDFVMRQPSFFKALDTIVQETPIEIWKAYLSAHLLTHFAPLLNQDWVDHHFDFYGKTLSGKEKNEPRWKRGIEHIEGILGEALGKVYVAKHFKPEAKARMEKLVDNLLVAFRASVKRLDWMGDETKSAALKKLDHFTVKIGYPNEWRDYSALKIRSDDLIGNEKRATIFTLVRELNKLGMPINREEWFMPPQMVNAYYNPSMNEIVFPAAILQPPFFNMAADDAVNYGGIGAVIGHEISHGFDDQGRKSDGEGRLTDWWTEEDAKRFQERAEKLSSHYESYTPLKEMKINGALTLGENIGDLGGLTIAYEAYLLSLRGKEAQIMDRFTGPQRFFLSWAQVWACKYREEELRRRLLTDPHSPAMYRVTGIIRQMPAFYEAFGLSESDQLYLPPSQRVKIW